MLAFWLNPDWRGGDNLRDPGQSPFWMVAPKRDPITGPTKRVSIPLLVDRKNYRNHIDIFYHDRGSIYLPNYDGMAVFHDRSRSDISMMGFMRGDEINPPDDVRWISIYTNANPDFFVWKRLK